MSCSYLHYKHTSQLTFQFLEAAPLNSVQTHLLLLLLLPFPPAAVASFLLLLFFFYDVPLSYHSSFMSLRVTRDEAYEKITHTYLPITEHYHSLPHPPTTAK